MTLTVLGRFADALGVEPTKLVKRIRWSKRGMATETST
jgi:hypothetical protein